MSPIHWAAMMGDLKQVKQITRADPSAIHSLTPGSGWLPLHLASCHGHDDVASYLIHKGVAINYCAEVGGPTALYLACREGHTAVVNSLLRHGADPTIPDHAGWTPLLAASYSGHWSVVKALVHCKVPLPLDISPSDDEEGGKMCGSGLLWWACSQGHAGVVRVLLEAGADPMVVGHNGFRPMDIARAQGHLECVKLLEVRRPLISSVLANLLSLEPSQPFLLPNR